MEYKIVSVHGHWEGYIDGVFFCSGDTLNEVVDTIEEYLEVAKS